MPNIIETTDAAAGTSTTYSLTSGQTAQGTLGSAGDHDWYSVTLVAGQTYTFAMTGTGVNNVQDTYLRLYAPGGSAIVASDDNGLQGANSIFSYTASSSGTYFIDAGGSGAGQYGVSFTAGARSSFDTQMGAGVIDTDIFWGSSPVSVGFRLTNDNQEPNFFQFTAQQMTATLAVLQNYSDVCGLTFNVVNSGGYTDSASILLSTYNYSDNSGGYSSYPTSAAFNNQAADIHINVAGGNSTSSLPQGSYSYYTLLHEMGHSMGLSHPGKYNAAPGVSITYTANAQFVQDTQQYTVMSYFDESNTTGSYGSYPDTLMLWDVYALQQIYGVNNATRSTDTIYGFGSNAGSVYDFATNTNPALCIWDGGGTDTLNCSGFSQNQVIDLNSGAFSNIGGLTGNVSIALGAVIENAVGGSGGDHIYLSSASTNNLINGSGGTDFAHVTYTYGTGYTVSGTASNFALAGAAGTDTFQNIEYVIFVNGTQVSAADLIATQPSSTGQIAISDVTILEGDGGTKVATFNVTRTGGTAAFAVNFATANGTATAGSDYVATSGTLNFANGVNSQTVSVTINGDTSVEQDETFFVNLSAATNGATITDSQGQGTITDDEPTAVAGAISISDLTITEGNTGTQVATFNVTRTGGTAAFAVSFATANGTATAGSDYVATSGTLNFAASVNTQTVSVTINGDTVVEPNETFFVNLSGATNGATLADNQGQATIVDNDVTGDDFADSLTDATVPFGTVNVGASATGNLETAGDHDWFRVTLAAGVTVTIDLQGVDTAAGTLSDPYLYLYSSSGQLLTQNDDAGIGYNSQLTYTPSVAGTYYIDAAAYADLYTGTYRINVTQSPNVAGSIAISDLTITEGNSGTQVATFTVARTGGAAAFSVNYATANGTATAGSDYVATSGTLNFAAGVNTQTVSVTINGDTATEPNETFFVNLSGPTNGTTIADSQGQGTIIDNDGTGDDFADSFVDTSAPFGQVSPGSFATGNLESIGDRDWFRVSLAATVAYTIDLQGAATSAGTLSDPYLYLYDASGNLLTFNDDSGDGTNSRLTFTPGASASYYLAAAGYFDFVAGTYRLSVSGSTSDDYADTLTDVTAPLGQVAVNGSSTGYLEATADRDWFQVQLTAGITYVVNLQGQHAGEGTLEDPYLRVHNSTGAVVAEIDDIVSGIDRDSQLSFTASATGIYYIEAGAFNDNYTGTYRVGIIGPPALPDRIFAQPTTELAQFGASPGAGGWSSDDLYPRELADVNGDGRADIVAFGFGGVSVALATGGGHFAQPISDIAQFGASAAAGGWTSNNLYPRELADVNGDGMADIAAFGFGGVSVSLARDFFLI